MPSAFFTIACNTLSKASWRDNQFDVELDVSWDAFKRVMEHAYSVPIINCGCQSLGIELDKISKALPPKCDYPSFLPSEYELAIDGISRSAWRNGEALTNLIERTTDVLESASNVTSICFLHTSGCGHTLSALLLAEIKDNFPELSIISVLISPVGGISGLSSLQSLVTMQAVMEFSDYVMIREMDEAHSFISSELCPTSGAINNRALQPYTLSDINQYIATDIFVALSSHSRGIEYHPNNCLWPFGVCSNRKKIFDVRSSLWRSLRQSSKPNVSFSALRAVSSSIHSAHLWHGSSEKLTTMTMTIGSAAIADLKYDCNTKQLIASDCSIPSADVAVALEWATPKVAWPPSLGTSSYRDSSTGCLVKAAQRVRSDPQIPSNAAAGSALGLHDVNLVAVSFASPYASAVVTNVCDTAQRLINVSAFSHR